MVWSEGNFTNQLRFIYCLIQTTFRLELSDPEKRGLL